MQKMMPVMMREMIPERKSRCFRLLFRQMPIQVLLFDMVLIITPLFYYPKRKTVDFFWKYPIFYSIFAIRMKRHNKTIVNRAKFYVLLCVGSNTEYNPPCPVLAGKQFIGWIDSFDGCGQVIRWCARVSYPFNCFEDSLGAVEKNEYLFCPEGQSRWCQTP